jgi:hypothetical protein
MSFQKMNKNRAKRSAPARKEPQANTMAMAKVVLQ